MSPTTSPHCPKYTHCKIHTRWTGIPSSTRAVHNAGQCTRSNAFDKSKLMIHTGIPTASALSKTKLAVTRCSSSRRPGRNPCCCSGCPASNKCSSRPASEEFATVMDGVRVQMDYILNSVQLQLVRAKYDFAMPIGLDHRCVHCTMKIPFRKKRFRKQFGFKCWRPILDEHGHPTSYQQHICEMIASSSTSTASDLENILLRAGVKHGISRRQRIVFSPSEHLQQLRVARRQTVEQHLRKDLSLQIRQIHRQELKQWKSNPLVKNT